MKQRIRCPCCDSIFEVKIKNIVYFLDKEIILDKNTRKHREKKSEEIQEIYNKTDLRDRVIIKCLLRSKCPLSVNDIAKRTTQSWNTVKKHCLKLEEIGYLKTKIIRKAVLWIPNLEDD